MRADMAAKMTKNIEVRSDLLATAELLAVGIFHFAKTRCTLCDNKQVSAARTVDAVSPRRRQYVAEQCPTCTHFR